MKKMDNKNIENGPLVSIVVPAYNVAKYIKTLIDSIVQQTYNNWELIIIDDKSTDDLFSIVSTYDNPRIKLVRNTTNLGLSGSRNKGIDISTGEYIQFLDGDDFLDVEALEVEVGHLLAYNADIVSFNYHIFAEDRELTSAEKRLNRADVVTGEYRNNEKMQLLFNGSIHHFAWSFVIKKSLFNDKNNFFPEGRLFEDFATIYKWLYSSKILFVSNRKLYNYLQRNSSIMHNPKLQHAVDINQTVKELDLFIRDNELDLETEVAKYEIPRLLNAYGINLKCEDTSKEVSKDLRHQILTKIKIAGSQQLSFRDKIKIILIKINLLWYLYKVKKMVETIRKHA